MCANFYHGLAGSKCKFRCLAGVVLRKQDYTVVVCGSYNEFKINCFLRMWQESAW